MILFEIIYTKLAAPLYSKCEVIHFNQDKQSNVTDGVFYHVPLLSTCHVGKLNEVKK